MYHLKWLRSNLVVFRNDDLFKILALIFILLIKKYVPAVEIRPEVRVPAQRGPEQHRHLPMRGVRGGSFLPVRRGREGHESHG